MPRIRRGGKRIRGSNGGRTRKQDCCCECTATTPQTVAEYIRDNSIPASVVITADDYTCIAGACSELAGTYSIPFDSIAIIGAGPSWRVTWSDVFLIPLCGGADIPLTIRVQLDINSSLGVTATVEVDGGVGSNIFMRWTDIISTTTCAQILAINSPLSPFNTTGSGGSACGTNGGDGSVGLSL